MNSLVLMDVDSCYRISDAYTHAAVFVQSKPIVVYSTSHDSAPCISLVTLLISPLLAVLRLLYMGGNGVTTFC